MNIRTSYVAWLQGTCLAWLVCLSAHAADHGVAVVDMEILLKAHADTAVAETVLKKQADEFEAERSAMLAELDELTAQFEAIREDVESRALSELGREQRRLDAQEIVVKIREGEKALRETTSLRKKQLTDRRKRMRQRIVQDIRDTISAYAKSRKFTLVLERHSKVAGVDMVLYASDAVDVTDQLRRRIEEETSP